MVTLPAVHIHEAESAADIDAVRELLQQYWTSFGFTPCFQNFAQELEGLPGLYARPSGCLLLARIDEQPAGCAAYRRIDAQHCEAKRLYVTPAARGHKLGRLLTQQLIEEARQAGYQELLGDSLPVMKHALALYEEMGFIATTLDSGVLLRYKL